MYELPERPKGPVGALVHLVFNVFEMGVLLLLVPIRFLSVFIGRTAVFMVRFPAQVLGVTFNLAGYLFVLLVLVLFAMALARVIS